MPAGASSVTFTISTNAAAPPTIVQIMAAVQNVPRTANLPVNAATPGGAQLAQVSVTPTSVTGGSPATGTVRFTANTNGAVVQLASSNPAVVQVPSETVVSGGAATGAFAVATSPVECHHHRDDHREMVRHHAHDPAHRHPRERLPPPTS